MGKRGTFAVRRDDLNGSEGTVCHGGDKIGRVSRSDMLGLAVQKVIDEVASDLLARFGGRDHFSAQPPVLRDFGLVRRKLVGDNLLQGRVGWAGIMGTMLRPYPRTSTAVQEMKTKKMVVLEQAVDVVEAVTSI